MGAQVWGFGSVGRGWGVGGAIVRPKHCLYRGSRGFNSGGVDRAPRNWGGGVREKVTIDRTIHQLLCIWRQRRGKFLLSIENGQFFSLNTWQMMTIVKPLDALIPKTLFSFFFCRFSGPSHLRGPGVSLGRIFGGPSIELFLGWGVGSSQRGLYRLPPPPPELKTRPPQVSVLRPVTNLVILCPWCAQRGRGPVLGCPSLPHILSPSPAPGGRLHLACIPPPPPATLTPPCHLAIEQTPCE